jgi:hypothetical protein
VQRTEEEGAGLVPRKDAAGPVASVRCGREADEEELRGRVAESGQRPRPVTLRREPPRRVPRRLFPPADEPRAAAADDDLALDRAEFRKGPSAANTCP